MSTSANQQRPAATQDAEAADRGGPLSGLRVVELGGIGPGPHTAMMLADLGADVVCVLRPGEMEASKSGFAHITRRGRRVVELNLKDEAGLAELKRIIGQADVLLEGFRPGVTERMGIGPQDCAELNPKLIYARMTGWGQDGPWAHTAGHDINYLSITGHLNAIGRKDQAPVPPLNLGADFGGGSMFCITGILAALYSRNATGKGQTIDVAMVDGAATLGQFQWAMRARGQWSDERGTNLLDTGMPFYDIYECSDGKFMAVGCIEPQFYAVFAELLGLDDDAPGQFDFDRAEELRAQIAARFATRTRDEWAQVFAGSDACTTPVLTYSEALEHPHNVARGIYIDVDGDTGPGPAPRFSGTPAQQPAVPPQEAVSPSTVWS